MMQLLHTFNCLCDADMTKVLNSIPKGPLDVFAMFDSL